MSLYPAPEESGFYGHVDKSPAHWSQASRFTLIALLEALITPISSTVA